MHIGIRVEVSSQIIYEITKTLKHVGNVCNFYFNWLFYTLSDITSLMCQIVRNMIAVH